MMQLKVVCTRGVHLILARMRLLTTWQVRLFHGGVDLNSGTKCSLNTFTLSRVIESTNMRSRNTLAKIVCV